MAVGTTIRLYYDRAAGPLPAAEARPTIKVRDYSGLGGGTGLAGGGAEDGGIVRFPSSRPSGPPGTSLPHLFQHPLAPPTPPFQVGWNGWETQQTLPLRRVASLEAGEWWCADLGIPDLLTRAEFVVFDEAGGVHDNNR